MPGCVIKAILLSCVVASMSFFISHSHLAGTLRVWLLKRSKFFGTLADCSYCLGHWMAAILILAIPVRLFGMFWPVDYVLTWIVISWMAGLQSLVASWLWGD